MNTLRLFRRLAPGLAALALAAALPAAEDRAAILARMEQRLAAVDELKERKLVGENNRGYLEGRAALVEGDRVFERNPAAFQLSDDLLELGEGFFKGQSGDVVRRLGHGSVPSYSAIAGVFFSLAAFAAGAAASSAAAS